LRKQQSDGPTDEKGRPDAISNTDLARMSAARRMRMVAYLKTGPTANHNGGWRHPAADLADLFSPDRYAHLARVLEHAMFDAAFFADTFGVPDIYKGSFDTYLRDGGQITYVDPLMVLPIMAQATQHLGLGTTLSTTFHNPYQLARILASFDLISGGRACWNVVTSATEMEARNFGTTGLPPKDQRYDQADEVLEACCALWECWQPDALVMDREAGIFTDPSKVRYADYNGQYIRTRGPLAMPRSPQTRPVFLQAGASDRGREFAARWAEAIFCTPHTRDDCAAFYADIKARMVKYDRPPEECAVLPSIAVVVGETESIAKEKAAYLNDLISGDLVLAGNSAILGADLSVHDTPEKLAAAQGNQGVTGSRDRVMQLAKAEGISFAEAARRPRGVIVGTPGMIADHMEDWFRAGVCDGFIIWPTVSPLMFEEFGRMVVPELQRRGLVRTEYGSGTLRDNLRAG
jgi:FMN-dependent oxidoreductase (nitrilotriacetate monooxygenase family)